MDEIRIDSWGDFREQVRLIRQEYGHHLVGEREEEIRILFRGHADADWPLLTTLERKSDHVFDVEKYMLLATGCVNQLESFTGERWKVPSFPDLENEIREQQDFFRVKFPAYDYLVYLRQHGFPSPFLDWTESPYIAAYFAFCDERSSDRVAIYAFIERPSGIKRGGGGSPKISLHGPYVTTHKTHFSQKAWYSTATIWSNTEKRHSFCNHSLVFQKNSADQDVLIKLTLPASERVKALSDLDDFNINHFTLFQTEHALIKAMEIKQFDFLLR